MKAPKRRNGRRCRAAVAVQVAMLIAVLVGFAALAFDVNAMYNTKADLQRAVDAAALAAATMLADDQDPMGKAEAAAHSYVAQNPVFGRSLSLDTGDIVFGRIEFGEGGESWSFTPTQNLPDAVRVRLRMTEDSSNGPMPLYFARIFSKDVTEIEAEATAVMVPRDIAVVADLSGSHNDDTEFPNDIHPVWDDLSKYCKSPPDYASMDCFHAGADEENGGMWGPAYACGGDADCAYQRGGPAWGLLKDLGWGDEITEGYSQWSDPGLVYLPKYEDWNNSMIESALASQGYIPEEINAIMSDAHDDGGAHTYRTAVALGLARWNSGVPGGLWEQLGLPPEDAGNGNDWVGGSELTWTARFGDRTMGQSANVWKGWINSNPSFSRQYGLKGFVNYLLKSRPRHSQTPELSVTPEEPMQSVKDAVAHLTYTVENLETDDQMSLEIYGETARHEVDLTKNCYAVSDRLNEMQAGHYDTWTNMGGGIGKGIEELTSERTRPTARQVMILLTDGRANVDQYGNAGYHYEDAAKQYARDMADDAAAEGIMIFTVSVGNNADTSIMDELADIGNGDHFAAQGSLEEVKVQLTDIFQRLGGARPVELIE